VSVISKPGRGPTVRRAVSRSKPAARKPQTARKAPDLSTRRGQLRDRFVQARPADQRASFDHAAVPAPSIEEQFSIPLGYGDDRVMLMVKDPWWLFAYWEVQPGTERAVRGQLLPQEVPGLQTVLRVYDVTNVDYPAQPAERWFDIPVSGLTTSWYVHTNAPGRSFLVEIGLLTGTGRFLMLVRSNRVTAPRFGPAEPAEGWGASDDEFWKLFDLAAGVGGKWFSPGAWTTMMQEQWSSGGWVQNAHQIAAQPVKGFWARLNTDIVIHGSTEPNATVSIQGQNSKVQKDGTFSVRLALPEGSQTVSIQVTSADGRKVQTFTPTISLASAGPLVPAVADESKLGSA
jgi:hypothetical protein